VEGLVSAKKTRFVRLKADFLLLYDRDIDGLPDLPQNTAEVIELLARAAKEADRVRELPEVPVQHGPVPFLRMFSIGPYYPRTRVVAREPKPTPLPRRSRKTTRKDKR